MFAMGMTLSIEDFKCVLKSPRIIGLGLLLQYGLGLASGYAIAKCLGYDEKICRTLSIEVGMQNSGLGVALATKYFTAMTAWPATFFSIWHNITGSLLAAYWTRKSIQVSPEN